MKLHVNRRKDTFTVWVIGHWHRLPRESVETSSLGMFKCILDRVLNNVLVGIMLEQGA